ncbi:penicillin binding protein 1A [Paucilactobacillus oligofermentans DSM 15707 = LMG 22743]|uniref:Penicillin binding protein 1A n=1 Tax=Paucilactobacillus oligofermentans DSM 15707 = LMG 22743 TaxID=1423778 RepID=A0A0R1RN12_9LACO|nr:PBP1A family penicillin-binding protein [Paucilactobacillus oligofermentans]KRL54875.1 penicillin binding protein 1A [Paucilactobacillus oligofermentans DSM 15707 = LMG 22743]CUS26210.1 Penicillin-binding protein 1A [Paucilactobacillus oligofermentans DSM 15707 = LMG 22743]
MSDNQTPSRSSRRNSPSNGDKKPRNVKSIILKIIAWGASIFGILILLGAVLFFYWASSAPEITQSSLESQNATKIYDSDNNVISQLGVQKREYVKSSAIPKELSEAVVSIEDRRFYKHNGVDPVRILGAAFSNITGSSTGLQGGSTLTQQLVKLSVFSTKSSDQTFKRKAQEAWLAISVERHFSKKQILEYYINKVYMGNGVYGMQTGAQYYYGKNLKDLTIAQYAMLAGIPQSPTYYNPITNPKVSTTRRNEVLEAMARSNYITNAEAKAAEKTSVQDGLDSTHGNTASADSSTNKSKVVDSYLKQVVSQLKSDGYDPYNDSLEVHTNLNMGAQQNLYDIVNDGTVAFQSSDMQVGAAVTSPKNGKILAMIGGRKTGDVTFGLNRAVQTDRSSGSTSKPIMDYAPAIEYLNYPTYRSVKDLPFTYPGTTKKAYDFDREYQGTITMRSALTQSRNIPALRTLQDVGITKATKFLTKLGITSKTAYELQNGIGLYISPLQEAASYAAFANGGTYYKPYYISSITTKSGETHKYSATGEKAMKSSTAYMITDMLKDVIDSSSGTGKSAALSGVHQAGKTGTTEYPSGTTSSSGVMDSWFTGYTKKYSISVWTGYDKQYETGHAITSSYEKTAALVYSNEMSYLEDESSSSNWTAPDTVTEVTKNGNTEYEVTGATWSTTGVSDTYAENNGSTGTSSTVVSSSTISSSEAKQESESSSSNSNNSSSIEQTPGGSGGDGGSDGTSSSSSSTVTTPTQ